jgi:hypothetical protein
VTIYHNFDLRIRPSGDGYEASVDSGFSHTFTLPFGNTELKEALLHERRDVLMGKESSEGFTKEKAKQFGTRLFNAVFDKKLARSLQQNLGEHTNVRLRLFLEKAPELAQLPWEYLYDDFDERWLALQRDTPIVRFLGAPQPIKPLSVEPPLRILVVVANPSLAGYAKLNVEQEILNVDEALGELELEGRVMVDYLKQATLDSWWSGVIISTPSLDRWDSEGHRLLSRYGRSDLLP